MSLRKLLGKGKKTSTGESHHEGKSSKLSPVKDVKKKPVEEKGSSVKSHSTPRTSDQKYGSTNSFEEQQGLTEAITGPSNLPVRKETRTSNKRMTLTKNRPTEIDPSVTILSNDWNKTGSASCEQGIINPLCELDSDFQSDDSNWLLTSRSRHSQLGDGKQTLPPGAPDKNSQISEQGDNGASLNVTDEETTPPEKPLSPLTARRTRRAKRMGKEKKEMTKDSKETGTMERAKSRVILTRDQSQQITEKGLTMSRVVNTAHCEELKHKSSTLPSLIRPSPQVKRRHQPREEQVGDQGMESLGSPVEVVLAPSTAISQLNFVTDGGQGEVGVLEEMMGDKEVDNLALASAGWESQRSRSPLDRIEKLEVVKVSVEDKIRMLVLQNEDFIACLADVCQLKMDLGNLFNELHLLRNEVEKCKEEAVNRDIEDKLNTVVKTGRSSLTLQSCDAGSVAMAEQLKNVPEDGVLVPCEGSTTGDIALSTAVMHSRRSYSITRIVYFVISCVYNNMARLWYLYLGMCPRF